MIGDRSLCTMSVAAKRCALFTSTTSCYVTVQRSHADIADMGCTTGQHKFVSSRFEGTAVGKRQRWSGLRRLMAFAYVL